MLSIPSSIISGSNWENLKDIELQPNLPVCLYKKRVYLFLKLTGSHMEVEVTEKYVNRGAGYGLEIPCKYHVSGQEKAVAWVSNKVNLIIKEHGCVVKRFLDEKKK